LPLVRFFRLLAVFAMTDLLAETVRRSLEDMVTGRWKPQAGLKAMFYFPLSLNTAT
jgi:hypothetical protein